MRKVLFSVLVLLAPPGRAAEIVIRAARIIDGRGAIIRNSAVVVEGTKIRPHRSETGAAH